MYRKDINRDIQILTYTSLCLEGQKENKMKLKNLTPHNVVIVINEATKIVIPSDGIARVTETKTVAPSIDVDGVTVETFVSAFGEVENLPPQEEGIMLIVSALVASAAKGRDDLLVPGELVRDDGGNIVGCKSLRRP